jgi:DNA-binding CsgD family transcriptional regulator
MVVGDSKEDDQVSFSSLINKFSPEQTNKFMALIDACHQLKTEQDFKDVVIGPLRDIVPHECAVCGIGERGKLAIDYLINVDFPVHYFDYVITKKTSKVILNSPVAQLWASEPKTKFVSDLDTMNTANALWSKAVEKYNIRNMLVSGLHDLSGNKTSYFCFANCAEGNNDWYAYVVDLITPHLHKALTTICRKGAILDNDCFELTAREIEVLKLVAMGLTNTQLGGRLFISENTVKNHVQSIFKKLNVVNKILSPHFFQRNHTIQFWVPYFYSHTTHNISRVNRGCLRVLKLLKGLVRFW